MLASFSLLSNTGNSLLIRYKKVKNANVPLLLIGYKIAIFQVMDDALVCE